MWKRWLVVLASVLGAGAAMAQSAPPSEPPCDWDECQRKVRVTLHQADGTQFDRTFDSLRPIVMNNSIMVVAGQKLYIEAEVRGNRLARMVAVDRVANPDKTLTFEFRQENGNMRLTLTNPFPEAIKFNVLMRPLGEDGVRRASSCPVAGGGALFESWSFPVLFVMLNNPRVLAADEKAGCVH